MLREHAFRRLPGRTLPRGKMGAGRRLFRPVTSSPALTLDTPLVAVRGVGPARARALAAAGLLTVEDLLLHLPHRYEDRTAFASTAEAAEGIAATFRGQLHDLKVSRPRRRLTLVRGTLVDQAGTLPVAWFNRPYLVSQVAAGEEYLLSGTVRQGRAGLELLNPTCERAATAALYGGRIVPVYPAAGGVGPAVLRRVAEAVRAALDLAAVPDPLPAALRGRRGLPALGRALLDLHAPDGEEGATAALLNARRSPAHLRLLYGELLELGLEVAAARAAVEGVARAHAYRFDDDLRGALRSLLPFPLTGAQRRALREIAADLAGPHPMLRLLQGDVGSGKTVVAALALATAAESGLQGALMVPTEILAEQHFRSLERLYGGRYRLALVTAAHGQGRRSLLRAPGPGAGAARGRHPRAVRRSASSSSGWGWW